MLLTSIYASVHHGIEREQSYIRFAISIGNVIKRLVMLVAKYYRVMIHLESLERKKQEDSGRRK